MQQSIPYGRQDITQNDIKEVIDVLQSDFLTQGPKVPEFERIVAQYCGAKYAVAMNSATSALHAACLALDLGINDWLWTSPITFVASSNCGLYCGAKVDFIDIDPQTYNICPKSLASKLEIAERENRLPKIVVPVHLCGQPCDMEAIYTLSKKYGFKIIEDASHAIGGRYKNKAIGNCSYSDITIFSFHPVKIITTAEGGMAITNNPKLANALELLRSHGITRDPAQMTHESDGPWYYQQITLGFNYRMTELQAALGISQMGRLDQYVQRRHQIAERYNNLLNNLPLTLPWQHPDSYSGLHLYVVRLKLNNINKTHREVFDSLRNQGISVNLHYIPIYNQPYYQTMGFNPKDFPESEKYYSEAISLPMYPNLTNDQQAYVVSAIKTALEL
jgi:UDP-4-amino-4,6-dideoxy-N-acetyl-beta-L-altrosamine transaminase